MIVHLIEPLSVSQSVIDFYAEILKAQGVVFRQWRDRKEDAQNLIERCKDANVVIVSNIPIGKKVIDACPNLEMISVAFTGVDHIDLDTCRKHNILVCNAAGFSTQSVVELTLGLMISALRNILQNEQNIRTGGGRDGYIGSLLFGKTIGIIGAGAIGQAVGTICHKVFNCKVLYFNRSPKKVDTGELVELNRLLQESDIISLHVPLNTESEKLISNKQFTMMKPSAILINTARGPVVDTQALVMALKKGTIAFAAIDMYEQEPPLPKNHPFLSTPNMILMPHIAYATEEAFKLRAKIVFENIIKWQQGAPQNVQ